MEKIIQQYTAYARKKEKSTQIGDNPCHQIFIANRPDFAQGIPRKVIKGDGTDCFMIHKAADERFSENRKVAGAILIAVILVAIRASLR